MFGHLFHSAELWECIAVLFSISYLWLILKENILGWVCAFISAAIYTVLFWNVSLLMDSALNFYYLGMAIVGFFLWRPALLNANTKTRPIIQLNTSTHVAIICAVVFLSSLSGYLLDKNTEASWPYIDSFTTWSAVVTTYLVAKKVLENWIYWIVIDVISLFLYIDKGMNSTAALFAFYMVMCIFGYFSWRKKALGKKRDEAH